jgi:DNA-binding beta-propeller fold protein YncE/phospholipase C
MRPFFFLGATAVLILSAILISQQAPRQQAGDLGNGATLLVNGWRVQPAGDQLTVDTLPMTALPAPDGKLLVLNAGYNRPTISVIDPATKKEVSRSQPLPDAWLGMAWAPDQKTLYLGGGVTSAIQVVRYENGKITYVKTLPIQDKPDSTWFVGDVAVSKDGKLLYAAVLHQDLIAVVNAQTGVVVEKFKTGRRPYRLLWSAQNELLVSSWADGAIYIHEPDKGERRGIVRVGPHTTAMLWSNRKPDGDSDEGGTPWSFARRLFVTAANTNEVYVLGATDQGDLQVIETINLALTPRMPAGMTPSHVALSPDQKTLYVTCSDANAVAVVDVSKRRSQPLGHIPTGWYPTAVHVQPDSSLIVLNGKGTRSYPNLNGPQPATQTQWVRRGDRTNIEYVGRLQKGSLSFLPNPDADQLASFTARVRSNSPYNDAKLDAAHPASDNPIPTRPGLKSPIEHVIYIVKENRTYDQVFGDLKEGNGDPSLLLFGPDCGPNHRKLAQEFVLFDNFYVNADVSADGHNWSTSAIANDYVAKMWPNSYGGRRRTYDYEGGEPAALPPAGYIWTNAQMAGVSMRNYGWWAEIFPMAEVKNGIHIKTVRDAVLRPVTAMNFRGYDLDYPDVDRAKTFIADLKRFETEGAMPRLIFLRMGNDHTYGLSPGRLSPRALFADNDYALGMVVDAVSKSKFWAKTAIFVVEDDAQNGPDHVDSHRSPAFAISPYTRRGITDSTMYNTTSILRTMELILGLRPMTQFDAAATPMYNAFATKPDTRPYDAVKPSYPMNERNPTAGAEVERSRRLDFAEADTIDDNELNAILWRALKKTDPPAPRSSSFAR